MGIFLVFILKETSLQNSFFFHFRALLCIVVCIKHKQKYKLTYSAFTTYFFVFPLYYMSTIIYRTRIATKLLLDFYLFGKSTPDSSNISHVTLYLLIPYKVGKQPFCSCIHSISDRVKTWCRVHRTPFRYSIQATIMNRSLKLCAYSPLD